jgi:hypothetical protein
MIPVLAQSALLASFVIFALGAVVGVAVLLATDAWVRRCRSRR